MGRQWYEVRVREQVGPEKWVKKSKFYFVKGPGDASKKYRGSGFVMWVQKVSKEKLLGVGSFFGLGDQLLKDLRKGGGLLEEVRRNEGKNKKRGYYGRKRKETTN